MKQRSSNKHVISNCKQCLKPEDHCRHTTLSHLQDGVANSEKVYFLPCTIALSTVILFLKHKPCRVSCQQFFNDRMISTNIRKLIADKLKYRRKLQETHVGRNPYKAPVVTSWSLSLSLLLSNIYILSRFSNTRVRPR